VGVERETEGQASHRSVQTKGFLAPSRVQHDDHVCLPLARTDRCHYFAENPRRRTVWFSRF